MYIYVCVCVCVYIYIYTSEASARTSAGKTVRPFGQNASSRWSSKIFFIFFLFFLIFQVLESQCPGIFSCIK